MLFLCIKAVIHAKFLHQQALDQDGDSTSDDDESEDDDGGFMTFTDDPDERKPPITKKFADIPVLKEERYTGFNSHDGMCWDGTYTREQGNDDIMCTPHTLHHIIVYS